MNENNKWFNNFLAFLKMKNNTKDFENAMLYKLGSEEKSTEGFKLSFNPVPKASAFFNLVAKIKKNIEDLEIQYEMAIDLYSFDTVIEYASFICLNKNKLGYLDTNIFKNKQKLDFNNNVLFILLNNQQEVEYYQKSLKILEINLVKFGFTKLKIVPKILEVSKLNENINTINQPKLSKENINNLVKNIIFTNEKNENNKTIKDYKKTNTKGYKEKKILDIADSFVDEAIIIKGKIFKQDSKMIKNGEWNIVSLFLTDEESAIEVNKFYKSDEISEFQVGDEVIVYGRVKIGLNNEKQIGATKIEKTKNLFIKESDNPKKPRYEFHISTKMNSMDGLIESDQLIEKCLDYKIPGAAITDLNGIQSFPMYYLSAQKHKEFFPIFGATFSSISKHNQSVYGNTNEIPFNKLSFISFDLETTSLSPRFGDIIEFGSLEINNGKISNKPEQFFLKTDKKLSTFTIGLTKITDDILEKDGLDPKEGLQKIANILDNKVAIAHNASFDMNFLLEKFRQYGIKEPNTIYLDSLIVSRIIFADARKHKLETLAHKLGVEYNTKDAHRADYDANVLAKVWILLQNKLINMNINNLKELSSYQNPNLFERAYDFEYSVIAKNQKGLKKLFKMISKSLTTDFYKGPRLFIEEIPFGDPDLYIGSSTLRGDLWNAFLYKSEKFFIEILNKLDYIEIPHIGCFLHYFEDFLNKEECQKAIQDMITYAQKYNKIPIAVSDAKYLSSKDKLAYRILVYAKGLKNVRHHFYNYEKARQGNIIVPDMHLLSTSEMIKAFDFLKNKELVNDLVIENTYKLVEKIEKVEVVKNELCAPVIDNSKENLRSLVYKTAHEKYGENLPEILVKRIEAEIQPITKFNYDIIYWISHLLVKKSMDTGYYFGSRGSVGSSIVATMSKITEINPLPPHYVCKKCKYFELANQPQISCGFDLPDKKCPQCNISMWRDGQSIPFETFLGFNADKVPDIDLNFSGKNQIEIHNEARRIFGDKYSFRAGTVLTLKEKTVIGHIRAYTEETGHVIPKPYMQYLVDKIQGVKKTNGKHAGGIIVIPKNYDIEDFTPINYSGDGTNEDWLTTHFDYKTMHDSILKLDLLGHDDPTMMNMLYKTTGIKMEDIPFQDKKVMSLFSSNKELNISSDDIGGEPTGALGLPEFGTTFIRKMLLQTKPSSFGELVSISGLSHGINVWTNNAEELITKKGLAIKDVICCRDDIMAYLMSKNLEPLFSFKVMEKVRKGKGVTDEEEEIMIKHKVPQWYIDSMRKIEYMFPKAHAVAYVTMAWRTAWYKLYYPLAFYAVYFSVRCVDFDLENMIDIKNGNKVTKRLTELNLRIKKREILTTKETKYISVLEIAQEFYARGFYIQNINIEKSQALDWSIDHETKSLIPPFVAIDGLGDKVAEKIIEARNEKPFISIEDFVKRGGVNNTIVKTMKNMNIFENLNETDQIKLI